MVADDDGSEHIKLGIPVLYDLSLKRYDALRGMYDSVVTRGFAVLAASQAILVAFGVILLRLTTENSHHRLAFLACAVVSGLTYCATTWYSYQTTKARNVPPLPNPMKLPELMPLQPEMAKEWLIVHALEKDTIPEYDAAYRQRSRAYGRALCALMVQTAWLFILSVAVPLIAPSKS